MFVSVRLVIILVVGFIATLPTASVEAVGLNEDGQAVVRLAADEYRRVSEQNPVVSHRELGSYVEKVARGLVPGGTTLPKGVSLSVTILDKQVPEIFSLANGVLVITTGALLTLENEAQLAAVLSHEAAHITGSHYPAIYQAFREGEKKARSRSLASGLAGVVVGAAIDYTVLSKTNEVYSDLEAGDVSYREAMKKVLALEAGAGVVEGFSDVYQGLPPETRAGSGDPRVPLEMVADAEGLKLLAIAGYDPLQAGEAWRRLRKAGDKAKAGSTESMAMAFLPPEMRTLLTGVEGPMGGIRAERLTRTVSQNPPDRPGFLDSMARSKEVTALTKGRGKVGREEFAAVIGNYVMGDARAAFDAGDYATSKKLFQAAWDSGKRTAPIAYYLGRSQVGEFAFAASQREKESAEEYLLKATEMDPRMPEPYKALGDLYGEWEMYAEAAAMYKKYLKVNPKASDRSRVESQIGKMERKAR
ncbi:MAG: M48 family metalloprotease [bacterium]|nr:M48 family metalloprotease [bacterium]MDT8395543.1 M48 family metalloprotease [bacterium]